MATVRHSLLLSFAQKYTEFFIFFISTLIVARLLTPAEIGVFSVAAVLVSLAHMVRAFGVGQYLIQEKELTKGKIRSAFGVTLALAWVMAFVLFSSRHWLADYYREPTLGHILEVLALNFMLIPFGSITISLLNREMKFGVLYKIKTASALAHAVTVVTLASIGFGAISMAWAAIAGVVVTILMAGLNRPADFPWLPGFSHFRCVTSFGGIASIATVMREIGAGAPGLVLGRVLGMEAVGLFGRANSTILLFDRSVLAGVMPVLLPHFAKKYRAGERLDQSYIEMISYITGLAWPFYAVLALMAYPLIRILYGPQWDAAVPIVQILCFYAAIKVLYIFFGQIAVAMGQVKTYMIFQLILQPIAVILIILGARDGLHAVAFAMIVAGMLGFTISHWYLRRLLDISFSQIIKATYKSLLVTVAVIIPPLAIVMSTDVGPDNLWGPFILAICGAGLVWLAAILVLDHPIRQELQLIYRRVRQIRETGF